MTTFWCHVLVCGCMFTMVTMVTVEDAYSYVGFPDPRENLLSCGVRNFSYICDPDNILTEDNLLELNSLIKSLQDVDRCLCDDTNQCGPHLHTVMVAIVPRIKYITGGFPKTDKEEMRAVTLFAEHLRDKRWQVFYRGCPLLAYIVYDVHTNKIWTTTDYNAKKVITNDQAQKVGQTAKEEYFSDGMIFEGLKDMVTKYKELLSAGIPGMAGWKILLILLGVIVGLLLLCCFCCCCRGGGSGGGGVFSNSGGDAGGGGCGGGGCGGGCGG